MAISTAKPEAVAVLDVGKTNVKLLAIGSEGEIHSSRSAPSAVIDAEPYPHLDTDHVWRWLMAALADLGERYRIRAILPTTHGAAMALVDDDDLVLPVLDYEAEPPPEIAAGYAEVAPWFEECSCPVLPGGQTLARQLFWQSSMWPEPFARAKWLLLYPQYWAWRLSGVPAAEATSLGAHTQLWNPRLRDFSGLARRAGWAALLPPLHNAFDVLGPLQPEVAGRCKLPASIPVLCGIHDSNANFARYLAAGLEDFTLISTGTWLITFNPQLPLERLDPLHDTIANTDLLGRPVASARFMGGREHALLAGDGAPGGVPDKAPDGSPGGATNGIAEVVALIARGTMALPAFTDSGGPFPTSGGRGRIVGPAPANAAERSALADLYIALMADVGLDLLQAAGQVVIDGSFAENKRFAGLLAALRPAQAVAVSTEREGTALGAALLVDWAARDRPAPLKLERVAPVAVAGLADHARRWRTAAETAVSGPGAGGVGSARRPPGSAASPAGSAGSAAR